MRFWPTHTHTHRGKQLYEHTLPQVSVEAQIHSAYPAMRSSLSFFISDPPLTSTSSTNTMPPTLVIYSHLFISFLYLSLFWYIYASLLELSFLSSFLLIFIYSRAFSSYLILPTISGSLSMLRSFISRSIQLLFISVSGDISPPRSNTVAVHDPTTPRPSLQDLSATLHTIYGYLTGLLLTLTTLKYQGSSTNPFSEHPTLMMLFLIAIFVYVIALIAFRSNHMRDHSAKLMLCVCHISGALACELLLLVLLSPMRSLFINVSSLAVIVMWVLCYKYILHLFRVEETEEPASHQMADLEAASTISTAYP